MRDGFRPQATALWLGKRSPVDWPLRLIHFALESNTSSVEISWIKGQKLVLTYDNESSEFSCEFVFLHIVELRHLRTFMQNSENGTSALLTHGRVQSEQYT
jgi:hypothetical protein